MLSSLPLFSSFCWSAIPTFQFFFYSCITYNMTDQCGLRGVRWLILHHWLGNWIFVIVLHIAILEGHIIRVSFAGMAELVWPVQFWSDHFFGISVPWSHTTCECMYVRHTYVRRAHVRSFSSCSRLSWHLAEAAAEMIRRSPRFLMLTIHDRHTTFPSEHSGRRTL